MSECGKHFEKISEYLDGELDRETLVEIERHLSECPRCENCVESLKRTIALCRRIGGEVIPHEAQRRIKEKVLECLAVESH
jgi:RNA polymerase sigma-70 factor (ECF subfamily)